MPHYICTGTCKAVSENPGMCQMESCPQFGRPLEQCECRDFKHDGKQEHVERKQEAS